MNGSQKTSGLARVGIGAVLFLCFVSSGCKPSDPIRIGFLATLSGPRADLGATGLNAARLVIDQRNRSGGVAERQVQLVVKDDSQDPGIARRAVQDLISQKVSAIVGPVTSDMGMAVVPVVNEARVLLVSPTIQTEQLTRIDDYFFRVTATTRLLGARNATYQIQSRRMQRVAIAYDLNNRFYAEDWLSSFRSTFLQGGGEIVETLGYRYTENLSFSALATELMANKPDGIVFIANMMSSALLCQQIRRLDERIPVTIADWGMSAWLPELGGKSVEGVEAVQQFDRDSTAPRYQSFRKAYIQEFHREPDDTGALTAEAVGVVLDAIAGQKEGQSLKESVLAIRRFEGLQRDLMFDTFGDVQRPDAHIVRVIDGQLVTIE